MQCIPLLARFYGQSRSKWSLEHILNVSAADCSKNVARAIDHEGRILIAVTPLH